MTYYDIIVGISCGLAISVLLVVLTDKSFRNTWVDSICLPRLPNHNCNFFPSPLPDVDGAADEEANGVKLELDDHMIAFQNRNRFYQDGRFHIP